MPSQGVWCLHCFVLKMDTDFSHFGLESGIVFQGTRGLYEGIYPSNSKWVIKKEKCANTEILLVCINLSNDNIISKRPRTKMGVKKWYFLVWNRVGIFVNWAAHLHQQFPEVLPTVFYRLQLGVDYWVSLYPLDPVKKAVTPGFCGK